jgi:hypothetical protein
MISFHHSFSTRIFLDENKSVEREARRAQAAAALARAREEARTPNELREFWWFLRAGQGSKKQNLEGPRPCGPKSQPRSRPAETRALPKGGAHA